MRSLLQDGKENQLFGRTSHLKLKECSAIVQNTNDAFQQVATRANKAVELVSEIDAPSSEQGTGIEQINRAVPEMEKVIEQNASGAQQSASAARELNLQADQMKCVVNELVSLVGERMMNGKAERGRRAGIIKNRPMPAELAHRKLPP